MRPSRLVACNSALSWNLAAAQKRTLLGFDALIPQYQAGAMRGKNLDDGSQQVQLLGSGKALPASDRQAAIAAVQQFVDDFPDSAPGWTREMITADRLLMYQHADHRPSDANAMVILSQAYTRARSRVSYYVEVEYYEGSDTAPTKYVARVKYFVAATPESSSSAQTASDEAAADTLRLAVADLYKYEVVQQRIGDLIKVPNMKSPTCQNYPVDLAIIRRKLVILGDESSVACFMPYNNISKTLE